MPQGARQGASKQVKLLGVRTPEEQCLRHLQRSNLIQIPNFDRGKFTTLASEAKLTDHTVLTVKLAKLCFLSIGCLDHVARPTTHSCYNRNLQDSMDPRCKYGTFGS